MVDKAMRDYINFLFEGYLKRKKNHTLYDLDSIVPQKIIETYYQSIKQPEFKEIYDTFKRKYIYNESRVDETLRLEEKKGLASAYDYIVDYDFNSKKFNVFIEGLKIHTILFSYCPNPAFGGTLRTNNVYLHKEGIEVPSSEEARTYFQSYLNTFDKSRQLPIVDINNSITIFDYINACIYVTTELIKYQPFPDGNKRTFRALLNLMFKQYNLPPTYIKTSERGEYKDALFEAMKDKKYNRLYQFYYYKICDSIYDLDIQPDIEKAKRLALTKENKD